MLDLPLDHDAGYCADPGKMDYSIRGGVDPRQNLNGIMEKFQTFDHAMLDGAGLNRQAVFDLDALPAAIAASVCACCPDVGRFRQLILIAHAGRKLWQAVQESGIDSADPIDDFTTLTVRRWFAQCLPHQGFEILYPGTDAIGLQGLGSLAGWHHTTPFKVGIDRQWGTWFAYRALVLADTAFAPSRPETGESACSSCVGKVCIDHCPAAALAGGQFDFGKCVAYRKQADSRCKVTCLARVSCPVGSEHRYCDAQIAHGYSRSLQAIKRYY